MKLEFAFFGSSEFSILVLDELEKLGLMPSLVVTTPDKPRGRKLILTPNEVKIWAQDRNIEVLEPKSLKNNPELVYKLQTTNYDLFLVASYGKIIPKEIFEIPKFKTLNIHPSLLPKYRGASPMISQILNGEKEMGTSIMLIDEGLDTGPVLGQSVFPRPDQGEGARRAGEVGGVLNIFELEKIMAKESTSLLAEILPDYLAGKTIPKPQDESLASHSLKIKKEDGLLDLGGDPMNNLLKIKAFARWPRAYYFYEGKRIIITDAELNESGNLKILRVIPEGKNEMSYQDFLRGQN